MNNKKPTMPLLIFTLLLTTHLTHSQEDLLERARTLTNQHKLEEAYIVLNYLIRKEPLNFSAHLHATRISMARNDLATALRHACAAVAIQPPTPEAQHDLANMMLNLGNAFFNTRRTQEALTAFRTILQLSPNYGAVHHNIAFTLAEQAGRHHEAIAHYHKALLRQPTVAEVHFCLANSYLATGNLLDGFAHYLWRWQRGDAAPRSFAYPLAQQWAGESIKGKRLYLRIEQGLGDTLQFIRYAKLLKEQGAYIILECQRPLMQLLGLCPYIDEIYPIGSTAPTFDRQIPLLDLPHLFKTTLETVPAPVPYLHADPSLVTYWQQQLAHDTNFKIGICWHGDSAHGAHKFMPKHLMARLGTLHGVSLYSLQKIDGTNNNEPLPTGVIIHQLGPDFDESHGRFMDTAAVMKNLDLVVTVDTSLAHLAGGLGVPTWVVLPFPAEWRWLLERNDSPWYPTMRLFRQQIFGDWEMALQEIEMALEEII